MAESISACSLECENSEVHKCKKTSTKDVVGILLDKAYVTNVICQTICAEALTLYPDTHMQDINHLVTTEANKMAIVSHV